MSFSKVKMTDYFQNSILRRRTEFLEREDDILEWINHPSHIETQSDGRKRFYVMDTTVGKWVRIVLLEDEKTIHNIFYDRNFKG